MKARLVRGAETRQRIIRTAADLFHKQGARATSPDEIIEASRTGKGQFYHYFKSKEGLIHEVLQAYLRVKRLDDQRRGAVDVSREAYLALLGEALRLPEPAAFQPSRRRSQA